MPFFRSNRNFRGRRKQRRSRTYRPIRFIRRLPLTHLKFPNPSPNDYNFVVDPLFIEEEDFLQYEYDTINMQSVKNNFFDDNDTNKLQKLHRTGSLPALNILNEFIEMYEKKYESEYCDSREKSPFFHFPLKKDDSLMSKMDRKIVNRSRSLVDLRYYFIMSPESIETVALLREFESACKLEKVLYNLNFCNFRHLITKANELGYLTPNIIRYMNNNNIYEILNEQDVVANKISKFNWILYYNIHKKKNRLFNNFNRKPSNYTNSQTDLDDEDYDDDNDEEEEVEEDEEISDDDFFEKSDVKKDIDNEVINQDKEEKIVNREKIDDGLTDGKVIEQRIIVPVNNVITNEIVDNVDVNDEKEGNLNGNHNNTFFSKTLPIEEVQDDEPVFCNSDNNICQKTEVLGTVVEINKSIDDKNDSNEEIINEENISSKVNENLTNKKEEKPTNANVIHNVEEAIEIINKSKRIVVLNGYQTIANTKVPHWKTNRDLLRKIIKKYNLNSYKDIFDMDFYKKNPFPLHEYANSFEHWNYKISNSLKFIKSLSDSGKLLRCYSENIDGMEYLARIPVHQFCAVNGSIACSICRICKRHYPWNSAPIANIGNELNLKYCEWCSAVVVPCISFEKDIKSVTSKYCTIENDALQADLLLIIGTSLDVSPFNLLPKLFPLIPKIMIAKSFNVNTSFIPDFTCLGDPDDIVRIIDGSRCIPITLPKNIVDERMKRKSKPKSVQLLYSDPKLNFIYEKNVMRNPAKTIALASCFNVGSYLTSKEKVYIHSRFCLFNSGEAYYLKNLPVSNKFIISPMQLRSIIPDKIYREVLRECFTFPNVISLLNSKKSKTCESIIDEMNEIMTILRKVLEYLRHIKLTHQDEFMSL